MRRPLYSRVFSLALSLWLPLFMSGAESVVQCPTHGGSAPAAAAQATTTAATPTAHDHGPEHPAPSDHGAGHNCSCPGPGCCPSAVAVVPTNSVPLAHIVAIHQATAVATLDRLSSATDHLLPFATAPPAVALAPAASIVV